MAWDSEGQRTTGTESLNCLRWDRTCLFFHLMLSIPYVNTFPVGFTTGEKTLIAFADVNRNLIQDDGEVSGTNTVSMTCW
jgi:hypothetical protein